MREIVTKVSIKVSDDGAKCHEDCPFLQWAASVPVGCSAFYTRIENANRCIPCFAREEAHFQIVDSKE